MKQAKLTPRNPLVAAVLFKKAGAHQKTVKAQRRQDKMALRMAVQQRGESAPESRRHAGFPVRTCCPAAAR